MLDKATLKIAFKESQRWGEHGLVGRDQVRGMVHRKGVSWLRRERERLVGVLEKGGEVEGKGVGDAQGDGESEWELIGVGRGEWAIG